MSIHAYAGWHARRCQPRLCHAHLPTLLASMRGMPKEGDFGSRKPLPALPTYLGGSARRPVENLIVKQNSSQNFAAAEADCRSRIVGVFFFFTQEVGRSKYHVRQIDCLSHEASSKNRGPKSYDLGSDIVAPTPIKGKKKETTQFGGQGGGGMKMPEFLQYGGWYRNSQVSSCNTE